VPDDACGADAAAAAGESSYRHASNTVDVMAMLHLNGRRRRRSEKLGSSIRLNERATYLLPAVKLLYKSSYGSEECCEFEGCGNRTQPRQN